MMNAALELEVYRNMVRFLKGAMSLRDFRHWYDSASWDQEVWTSDLASHVELALAELTSGHRTEQDVLAAFSDAVSGVTLHVPIVNFVATFAGESQNPVRSLPTLLANSGSPGSTVGKLRVAEYA